MEQENPLETHNFSKESKMSSTYNIRGRPAMDKIINFTPQPKSIVSQLLKKVTKESNDHGTLSTLVKEKQTTLETDLSSPHSKILVIDNINNEFKANGLKCFNEEDSTTELADTEAKNHSINHDYILNNDQQHYEQLNITAGSNQVQPTPLPFVCHVCSHISHTRKQHRVHTNTHKNQPYKCNYTGCSYSCKLLSNLIKHKRIHTSEKPYLCDQCTFRSNFVNSLKVHKRIHTSERPHRCKFCSYQCNSSSNLKKHCLHKHRKVH